MSKKTQPKMKVRILVAMPGYLPDSDDYPYNFRGTLGELYYTILDEYKRGIPEDEPLPDDWELTKEHIQMCLEKMMDHTLDGFSDDLPSTNYAIDVERV